MRTEYFSAAHPAAIPHAADTLCNGGLVAFPTDTVYGLASLPFDARWVEQLYTAKGRSNEKAIAVLVGGLEQLKEVTSDMNEMAKSLAAHFWPGPLTLIVPRREDLPAVLSPYPTIGVRMPDHPVALALLRRTGPLAVTSANRSGEPSPTTASEVRKQLSGRIHLILDGGSTPGGVPSTVVDCTTPRPTILRQGPITLEALEAALLPR